MQENSSGPTTDTRTGAGISCFHCGEECPDDSISINDKSFCCEGCKMVFEILNAHQLTQYYSIDDRPGISRRREGRVLFAWLDDEEIASQLIDYQDDKITRITLQLPQIHCASCIWLLEHLYRLQPGIVQSTVNFLKKEAYIGFDHSAISLRQVAELLSSIGYTPQLNLDSLDEDRKVKAVDRSLYYQLGVAGFAFGNIMLLSFPEYLGLGDQKFQSIFGYLNIILALPVVIYSSRSYLISAWSGLKEGFLNIDVPITLGIITLFLRSAFEIITHSGAGYLDSLAGLVFFLLIGKWFQQKTYHRLSFERDYKSYFPIAATLLEDGTERTVAVHKLDIGQTILVRNQELIPADGILIRGKALVDYSFVTGESIPVAKTSGEKLYAGGRQIGEAIEVTTVKKVSQSYLTQLWNDSSFKKEDTSQTASDLADAIGKRFTIVILIIAFLTLAYWIRIDVGYAVNAFTAVLIIACPCAVALSVPFTFGNIIRFMARKGMYLKNTLVIEKLARITTVVFDKTGTITRASESAVRYDGIPLSQEEKTWINALAAQSTHPVSRHIRRHLDTGNGISAVDQFEEVAGEGVAGIVAGHKVRLAKHRQGTAVIIDGDEKGTFSILNMYRSGFARIAELWRNNYSMYLLSGDRPYERNALSEYFPPDHLLFERSPVDKLNFIKSLQAEQNEKVLMLGDGLNDAGALQKSDVGIVVAENTNNFTPACDAILDAASFDLLPDLVKLASRSINVVYMSYAVALVYNIIGLSFAVQGTLSPVIAAILMPLSSITIVLFGVGMSSIVARNQFR